MKNTNKDEVLKFKNDKYWNRILNAETVIYVIEMAKKEAGGDSEEEKYVRELFDVLRENTDYKSIVLLAMQWKGFSEASQVNFAITIVGEYHASRFMIMMDYLSYRHAKGIL